MKDYKEGKNLCLKSAAQKLNSVTAKAVSKNYVLDCP